MPLADGAPRENVASSKVWRLKLLLQNHCAVFTAVMALGFLLAAWVGPKPWAEDAARRFAAQKPRPEDYASLVFFWVALANSVLCGVLALTARWWGRPLSTPSKTCISRGRREPIIFWITLSLLGCTAFLLRVPMATKSLWWDEIWTVKNAVVGYRTVDDSGKEKFIARDWARTFWHYSKPTNHVGFSVLSRCCVDAWRRFAGAERWEFNELAYRLPSLLAGVGSVFLLGWLARDLLGTISGLGCAALLATHPWFIRYSVDGRAFGLTVFFVLLAWLAMRGVLRHGAGWGWWIVYGIAVLMLMWVFPYNIYFPVASGLVFGFAILLFRPEAEKITALMRLAVVNLLAASIFLQLAGPWVPQALAWNDVEGSEMAGPVISPSLLRQTWLSFATGLPHHTEAGPDALPSYFTECKTKPWLEQMVWWGMPALALLGLLSGVAGARPRQATTRNANSRILLCILLSATLALGFAILVAGWKRHYFYDRYLIYFFPGLILAIAAGLETVGRGLHLKWLGVAAVWSIALALFLIATQAQRSVMLDRPLSPIKDVAESASVMAKEVEGTAFGYGLGGDTPAIYKPSIRHGFTLEKLLGAMKVAREVNQTLFVFYGYGSFNRANPAGNARDGFAYLDDPRLFVKVGEHRGIEDQFTYSIFRYTGVDPGTSGR